MEATTGLFRGLEESGFLKERGDCIKKRIVAMFVLISMIVFFISCLLYETKEPTIDVIKEAERLEEHYGTEVERLDITEIKINEYQRKISSALEIENTKDKFVEIKSINNEYKEYVDIPLTIYDVYSQDEIYIMCRCIETEVYQAPFSAKMHVAEVILNRIESERFGNTPYSVVTAPSQFAYFRTAIDDETLLALEAAFEFEDETCGALFFQSAGYMDTFNRASFVMYDGYHWFYR